MMNDDSQATEITSERVSWMCFAYLKLFYQKHKLPPPPHYTWWLPPLGLHTSTDFQGYLKCMTRKRQEPLQAGKVNKVHARKVGRGRTTSVEPLVAVTAKRTLQNHTFSWSSFLSTPCDVVQTTGGDRRDEKESAEPLKAQQKDRVSEMRFHPPPLAWGKTCFSVKA